MIDKVKDRLLFIVNPISGSGQGPLTVNLIKDACDLRGLNYSVKNTTESGHGSRLTKQGIDEGYTIIVAVGGDGTVNEIGKELIGTHIRLGILPNGSGNGLARHMGIPMNKKKAINKLLNGHKSLIDTGLINGYAFLNVTGIGFDAKVSQLFSKTKKRGKYNYFRLIIEQLRNSEVMNLNIKSDGNEAEVDCIMLSVANSSQYGNNAKIAPRADIGDGKLDVCILSSLTFSQAFMFFYKTMFGEVKKSKVFDTFQTKAITIEGGNGLIHIDGDPMQLTGKIEIETRPKSLYIIC